MRRRLILAFVIVVVSIVVLYGVPRAFVLSQSVEDSGDDLVSRRARVAAVLANDAISDGDRVTPQMLEPLLGKGERVEYRGGQQPSFTVPRNSVLGADDLSDTRRLDDGGRITYSLSSSELDERVTDAVFPLVVLGLALVPLGVLAGALLARRLSQPFTELAATARAMGRGDLRPEVRRYGVSEADEIASALDESGRRLHLMLQRERDVAVNASHELRTPITALRLALEDVALWPETPPDVATELERLVGEIDRLSEAVTTLLDARRRWSPDEPDDSRGLPGSDTEGPI